MSHQTPRLDALEPRRLFAITYSLIELDVQPQDLNNADQIVGRDLHQVRRGGRFTTTTLPTLFPTNNLAATQLNDDGIPSPTRPPPSNEASHLNARRHPAPLSPPAN
jgi:hypothetical protein